MILTKGKQSIELKNDVQIKAYKSCGWTEQPKKETKTEKK